MTISEAFKKSPSIETALISVNFRFVYAWADSQAKRVSLYLRCAIQRFDGFFGCALWRSQNRLPKKEKVAGVVLGLYGAGSVSSSSYD
jgi:hypothetical protein